MGLAEVAGIEHFKERIKQSKQNQFNWQTQENNEETLDADQSRVFLSGIWSESKEHDRNTEWLKTLVEENNCPKQECLAITNEMVSKQCRKIRNWKASGRDWGQACTNELLSSWTRFWIEINNCLNGWLMGKQFCAKKIKLIVTQWATIAPSFACH